MNVPYLRESEIENAALNLLHRYETSAGGTTGFAINVEDIAEHELELDIVPADLEKDIPEIDFGDAIGALQLSDMTIYVDEEKNRVPGRFRFTVAHEIAHYELHRMLLQSITNQTDFFNSVVSKDNIVCRSSQQNTRIEWQANRFAGALLMPERSIIMKIGDIKSRLGLNQNDALDNLSLIELNRIANLIMHDFNVSHQAVIIRLNELRILPRMEQRVLWS